MIVLRPPTPLPGNLSRQRSVFLAGSIEMNLASRWQDHFEHELSNLECVVLNPRRQSWDPSWEQRAENPVFAEQVTWELEALERCTLIAMYLDPATRAPVPMLELGLFARSGKLIVCCPAGFYRKGNVDLVCARYGVTASASLDALATEVRTRLAHR